MASIQVFISYSWDSDEHKAWVRKLADDLEEIDEVHVVWDGYDLDSMSDKNFFMESGITSSDYVIVVTTKAYKKKADERSGGVGIETFLAAAAHWDGMLKDKRTKIILARREQDSTPNYLAGHFYIDFNEDTEYPSTLTKITSILRGNSLVERPPKRKSLESVDKAYSLGHIQSLLGVSFTNKRPIVDSAQGTDFSGGNRIKYEIWQTKSPAISYFLALANNINIAQTIQHAAEKLRTEKIRPSEITVLRPRAGRPEQALIQNLLETAGFKTLVHEYTYKDYVWGYCINDSLKGMDAPTVVANYTDQSLLIPHADNGNGIATSAREYLVELLQKSTSSAAYLVVAPGGMGKTSLCLSVAAGLHNRNDLHSSVIVIQAEAIKKYVADQRLMLARIDSIYHLYEIYARFHGFAQIFDRDTFDIAVLCGNLVVIIDGLDEFTSLFPERFDLESFLISLRKFHEELGSSNMLLTTRNSLLIDDEKLEALDITKYELLGFDSASCEKYISRRFKGFAPDLVQKVLRQIDKIRMNDHEGRVVPFFADIVATIVEDQIREKRGNDFEVRDDPTPYPSNNELTDHIIHSVLRREETRHGLDIGVPEVVQLIAGLVIDYGKRWPAAKMRETLELLYDEAHGKVLFEKISLNPLLVQQGGDVELRYGFLNSYFEVLFNIEGILKQNIGNEFAGAIARVSPEGSEFRDLKRFFQKDMATLDKALKTLIPHFRNKAIVRGPEKLTEREIARKAIAVLLRLCAEVYGGSTTAFTERLLNLYGVQVSSDGSAQIEGLFIQGEFPAIDFSNLTVTNSKFQNYAKLLSSKFLKTRFIYTVFENCGGSNVTSSSLTSVMIDRTCELGDLREILDLSTAGKREEAKMVEVEAKKFLHCFFKGDRFTDNNRLHIKFSNRVPGLAEKKFDQLLAQEYIKVKTVKTVDIFYEVSDAFKPSVRRFLTDNYPDSKMKNFLAFVRG